MENVIDWSKWRVAAFEIGEKQATPTLTSSGVSSQEKSKALRFYTRQMSWLLLLFPLSFPHADVPLRFTSFPRERNISPIRQEIPAPKKHFFFIDIFLQSAHLTHDVAICFSYP